MIWQIRRWEISLATQPSLHDIERSWGPVMFAGSAALGSVGVALRRLVDSGRIVGVDQPGSKGCTVSGSFLERGKESSLDELDRVSYGNYLLHYFIGKQRSVAPYIAAERRRVIHIECFNNN